MLGIRPARSAFGEDPSSNGSKVVLDAGEHIDVSRDLLGDRSIESALVYAAMSDRRRSETMHRIERARLFVLPS